MIVLLLYLAYLYTFKNDIAFFIIDYIYNLIYIFLEYSSKLPFAVIKIDLEINYYSHFRSSIHNIYVEKLEFIKIKYSLVLLNYFIFI